MCKYDFQIQRLEQKAFTHTLYSLTGVNKQLKLSLFFWQKFMYIYIYTYTVTFYFYQQTNCTMNCVVLSTNQSVNISLWFSVISQNCLFWSLLCPMTCFSLQNVSIKWYVSLLNKSLKTQEWFAPFWFPPCCDDLRIMFPDGAAVSLGAWPPSMSTNPSC